MPIPEPRGLLDRIKDLYPRLSPRLQHAAKYVLDHPTEIAMRSMRQVANEAAVAPSSMIRLAKELGFPSYDDLRMAFQEPLRATRASFPDRARSLQAIAGSGRTGKLLLQMADANLAAIERLFSTISPDDLDQAADLALKARDVYVVGARSAFPLAYYFHYVARMALPRPPIVCGFVGVLVDELANIGPEDVLLAISFSPYSRETARAVKFALDQGARTIAITDSRAAPVAVRASQVLLASTESPQFFPSHVAASALVEALIAAIVARGGQRAVNNIALHYRLRRSHAAYWDDPEQNRKKR
jgi:DNA-binding MurR/RpiR family transcriptional regulator